MSRRTERVSALLQQEIGRLVSGGLRDPRLGRLVTVSNVRMSPDLQYATVSVTVLGGEAERVEALRGLRSASGYLRRELARVVTLRLIPELRFELDTSLEEGERVLSLLDRIQTGGPGRTEEDPAHG